MAHRGLPEACLLLLAVLVMGCLQSGSEITASSSPPVSSTQTSNPSPSATNSSPPASTNGPTPSTSPAASPTPPPLTTIQQTFELTSPFSATADWMIDPASLSVKNNTRLEVNALNADLPEAGLDHTWFIEVFNKGTGSLAPGENETIVVEIRKVGTFKYWCTTNYPNHRNDGMEGTLTVTA